MTLRFLQSVLALAAALMVTPGCERVAPKTQSAEDLPDFAFSSLENAEEVQRAVDKATSHPNVILVVHVDWAPMMHQQRRFAEFKRSYETKYPDSDLAFEYIDCTAISDGYEPLRSLPGWIELERQKNGMSLVHGYGELVWCKNGVVLNVENPLAFRSTEELITKTETLGMVSTAK